MRLALVMLLLGCTSARAADAATGPLVLELFTSQGCSSCPPADALLAELGARPDVIALAFHVDYWDRLGWKDPFSSARFTARQEAYGAALDSGLYTPQLVVGGRAHVVGSDRARATALLDRAVRADKRIAVTASRDGANLRVTYDAGVVRDDEGVLVAITESGLSSQVERGENAGRTLRGDFVVRDLTPGANGAATIALRPEWRGRLRAVVLVQRRGDLAIDGAGVAEIAR